MRIALVSFDFPEYCIRHANEMVREHNVLLILPSNQWDARGQTIEKMVDPLVSCETFHKPRFREPVKQLLTINKILRTIRRFKPDVVHFQHGHLFFNAALPLLRRYPLVVTIHDPRQHVGDMDSKKVPQWMMDFGYRRADRNIVHGTELVETVHRLIGIPKDRIHFVPHIAIGQPDRAIPGATEQGKNILFFGRIWEYKGLDYLIQAEPLITAKFPDAKIVIGGQGEDFDRYRKMMVHHDRFEVHNEWISDERRSQLFSNASIVVLPYVEATQSGVVPVAYTHGKPVVATRVGGLPEIVEEGVTGLLVAPRDVEGLADAINQLLASPERRQEMGRAGWNKLQTECEPSVVVPKTIEVYRNAIRDRNMTESNVQTT